MKNSKFFVLFFLLASCKRGTEPTACVKSFVDAKKVSTFSLDGLPGASTPKDSEFVAGGIFTSGYKEKPGDKEEKIRCAATFLFRNLRGATEIEVFTARHCTTSYSRGPYKIFVSGLDGYREIELESKALDTTNLITVSAQGLGIQARLDAEGLLFRPFQSSEMRESIKNKELENSIQQELGSYGAFLCGSNASAPKGINAQVGCFIFSDLVSFIATPKAGSLKAVANVLKSGNIASNVLDTSDQTWMSEVRQTYSVSRDFEIGRFLSTVFDCNNVSSKKFKTDSKVCTPQYIASSRSFLDRSSSENLFSNTIFQGYESKSESEKATLIKQSIDNYASSYGRKVAYWQSLRQKLQKGSLALGANFIGPKGPKYQLANLKDFQGSIPFIWRPYGIVGYIDNSMAKLDKGVSGSMLFLDGTPVAVISRVDGENTSSGSAAPSTGESKTSELNLPMASVLDAAEGIASGTSSTASNTKPLGLPLPSDGGNVGNPSSPSPSNPARPLGNTSPNSNPRRASADASEALDYGSRDSGC